MQVHARELFRFVDNLRTRTGLNKISDYPRIWRVCFHFKRATRLRPWTVRGRGLFPDSARLFRGKLAERCQDVTRILALATPWTILCPPGELLRGHLPVLREMFTGNNSDTARLLPGECPVDSSDVARMFRRTLRGMRRGHCADIARLAALRSSKGLVSKCGTMLLR
jgi:hypothetical protein